MYYKLLFKIKSSLHNCYSLLIKTNFQVQGGSIGKKVILFPFKATWPHKISIGDNCFIERNVFFKYDGIFSAGKSIIINNNTFIGNNSEFNIAKSIHIGKDVLIASGCKFIDHDHGFKISELIRIQKPLNAAIFIDDGVWIGCNAVILKGVTIGKGAIVAAGAVVNKSIPAFEIWGDRKSVV